MKRFFFLLSLVATSFCDAIQGRKLAFNVAITPLETSRGTASLDATAAIATSNYLVCHGADDRHFKVTSLVGDIPIGILINDQVATAEIDTIRKNIALLGLYGESLPGVAGAAIAVDALLVADLAVPGRVKTLPATTGTYVVIGRSRFTVAAAGDPVSIAHCVPYSVAVA